MNNDIRVIDNFLNEDAFNDLQTFITSAEFPWYFNKEIVKNSHNEINDGLDDFQFTHTIFRDFQQSTGPVVIEKFYPLFEKINPFAFWRVKANLNTYVSNDISDFDLNKFHVDIDSKNNVKMTTAVFYINTNNGYTLFEESKEKIYSAANRIVIFNSNLRHTGVRSTNSKNRIVVNLNYIDY